MVHYIVFGGVHELTVHFDEVHRILGCHLADRVPVEAGFLGEPMPLLEIGELVPIDYAPFMVAEIDPSGVCYGGGFGAFDKDRSSLRFLTLSVMAPTPRNVKTRVRSPEGFKSPP